MSHTLSLPFRFYNGAVATSYDGREIWKDRVFIALTTSLNERAMTPNYGTEISRAVFEPYALAEELIRTSISQAFESWLPALTLNGILLETDQSDGAINIRVNYTLPNAESDTLTLRTDTFNRYGEIVRGSI